MSLTSKARTTLQDKIDAAVIAISKAAPAPKSNDNKSSIAWDYWLWYTINSMVKGKFEAAKKAALRAGIIFDPAKQQVEHEIGVYTPYEGDNVIVWLTVSRGYDKVDVDTMTLYLMDHGVKRDLLDAAITHATFTTRRKHEFKPVLASE